MTFALSLYPNYPWEATVLLCIVFAACPFLISRYRSMNWEIPNSHYAVMLLFGFGIIYFFYQFQQSVYSITEFYFLWDNGMWGQIVDEQEVLKQVEYPSLLTITLDFLYAIWLPVLCSFTLGQIIFWLRKFTKYLNPSIESNKA